ncbi:TetR/AcrR family transcriptional regulator C-terminal domain-containing protein [Sphingomonas sp. LR61]|uniref:TetR/AcrR family transcriptional regulator C-terminal domain-containing protein n=1 Tax=Sphingomonas sp. LR61 TaxID=3050234 RepID=UPI002FE1B531
MGSGYDLAAAVLDDAATRPTAIICGKEELLEAATDDIISAALESTAKDSDPHESLRTLALAVFDALTEHHWVGNAAGAEPRQPAVLRIWKGIGAGLGRLGVSCSASADAGAALMNYLLGAAAQRAAASHHLLSDSDGQAYLEAFAAELTRSDSDAVSEQTAAALVEHDDREQFVNGLNIFLAGIEAGEGANVRLSLNPLR